MYVNPNKVILTDCDGVLLDWDHAFNTWMYRHGYIAKVHNTYSMAKRYDLDNNEAFKLIKMFNESAWIRRLSPLRDAVKYVRKLHDEHGYVFHVITSLSDDEYAQHLRTKNLRELFGDTIFERYVYLDCSAPKEKILKEYENSECFWIEDKYENFLAGEEVGLRSVLMAHRHNDNLNDVKRVKNWKEIYELVTGN